MDQHPTIPAPRTSTMAIISLVTGLMCIPILPIVLGHLARGEVRKSNGTVVGSGMALVGLILGYLPIVIAPVTLAFFLIPSKFSSDLMLEVESDSVETLPLANQDNELEIREDGFWYRLGSDNVFNGFAVSYHEDGMTMKSRTKIKEGKAYGLIEEWDLSGNLIPARFKDEF